MNPVLAYVAAINVLAFLSTALVLRWRKTPTLSCAFSIAGGGVGSLVALAAFDRRINKSNVAAWFSCLVGIVGWAMVVAVVSGRVAPEPDRILQTDWASLAPLGIYYAGVNLIALVLFLVDKRLAVRGASRVPESLLLFVSFIGGALGGIVAMHAAHHKTRTWYFAYGLPAMLVLQAAALAFALAI